QRRVRGEVDQLNLLDARARPQSDPRHVATSLITVRLIAYLPIKDGRQRVPDHGPDVGPLVRPLGRINPGAQTLLDVRAVRCQEAHARDGRALFYVGSIGERSHERERVGRSVRYGQWLCGLRLNL